MHLHWEKEFFSGVVLDMWRRAVPTEQTRAEGEFLFAELELEPGSDVLDIPCGNGRHSVELASRGCLTTGVDLSDEFIAEARERAPASVWISGDIREFDRREEFDAAFCFGNSFAHLNPVDAQRFLHSVSNALQPGGRFALETGMAAESILPTLVRNRWFELGDLYMLSRNQYDARNSCLDIEYTFIRNGVVDTRHATSYVFTVNELCRMHEAAGLEVVKLLGSVAREPYQIGSPRLIVTSRKL